MALNRSYIPRMIDLLYTVMRVLRFNYTDTVDDCDRSLLEAYWTVLETEDRAEDDANEA